MKIKLHFITGFLGSGKTTLVNRLLLLTRGKRVGLMLNDFGDVNIDKLLINEVPESGISELNGGQIFCSCISGKFIQAALRLAEKELDYIFVETSGLAKPSALKDILEQILVNARGKIEYMGMICVIDADRYQLLHQATSILDEQLIFSDRIIINQIDRVNEKNLQRLEKLLAQKMARATLFKTSYCQVGAEILAKGENTPVLTDQDFSTWGEWGRPHAIHIVPRAEVDPGCLEKLIKILGQDIFRLKGFVAYQKNIYLVEWVGKELSINQFDTPSAIGVTIHIKNNSHTEQEIQKLFSQITGADQMMTKP